MENQGGKDVNVPDFFCCSSDIINDHGYEFLL